MPSWKKLVTSGSSPTFTHITSSGNIKVAGNIYVTDTAGIYTDKIRRNSDSNNTTKILLNDEVVKIHTGHSAVETLKIQESSSYFIGNITASGNISSSGNIVALKNYSSGYYLGGPAGDKYFAREASGIATIGIGGGGITNILIPLPVTASGNISSSGTITAADFTTPGSITLGGHGFDDIDIGAEFTDADDHLMSAGAIKEKIEDYGYSTTTGDITGVTAGTNCSGGGSSGAVTINVDDAFLINDGSDTTTGTITAAGFTTTGILYADTRKFAITTTADGNYEGDVVYFGGTTSLTAGVIYSYASDGEGGASWTITDADAEATSKGLLGVALGAESDTNGMLLRGMVTLAADPGTLADVLFLDTTAGRATSTAPSGNTDIVRIIGYCLDSTNGQIWFNPDNTYIEVSA